jgi:hypothetical protein
VRPVSNIGGTSGTTTPGQQVGNSVLTTSGTTLLRLVLTFGLGVMVGKSEIGETQIFSVHFGLTVLIDLSIHVMKQPVN